MLGGAQRGLDVQAGQLGAETKILDHSAQHGDHGLLTLIQVIPTDNAGA